MTPIPTEQPRAVRLRADILQTAVFQTATVNRQCLVVIEKLHTKLPLLSFESTHECCRHDKLGGLILDPERVCNWIFNNAPGRILSDATTPHPIPQERVERVSLREVAFT